MAKPFEIGIAIPFDEAIAAAKARGVVLPEVFYGVTGHFAPFFRGA